MAETCIRFGQHGARVMIEDKEIPHYAIHVDPVKKEVSCWISSEAGKAFSVTWLELDVEYPTACELYLDGHLAAAFPRLSGPGPQVFRHADFSESLCAPLLFSPLDVTDDDTYLDISPHSIGEIKLDIVRTTVPQKKTKKQHITNLVSPGLQKVHERSKKAIAHRVGYGAETRQEMDVYSAEFVETLVTFIFKYRPLEMLQANDIVPRSPEPLEPQEHALDTPPASEMSSGKGKHFKVKKEVGSGPETDDSDEDSMREKALLAEVERCQAEVERIRKARGFHSKDSERPKKKLKEDKPFLITPGEIIDLT